MKPMKDPPTPARATYHHGDLRRALIDTALGLVAERGPEGFSLREAARAVGVSPAAAYRHFADKPALIAALAAEGHGRLAAAMEKEAERAERAGSERAQATAAFLAIGKSYVDFAVKNPSFFRVMFGPALEAAGFRPNCAPSGRYSYHILGDTLDRLVSTGAIPAPRRPGAEVAAWSSVHGFATLLVDGALRMGARRRGLALRLICRCLLAGLGCEESLLPAPTALFDAHPPGHTPRRDRALAR